jgi:hypothetical protein
MGQLAVELRSTGADQASALHSLLAFAFQGALERLV